MNETLRTAIALSLIPNIGARRSRLLLEAVADPTDVFRMKPRDLLSIPGIGKTVASGILSFTGWREVDRVLDSAERTGASLIPHDSDRYPSRLKEIYDAPLLLWLKGDPAVLHEPGIAVVGTRMPSAYGTGMAERFTEELVAAGCVIISGLAYGIDTYAHRRCVKAGGRTIAVLGSGIDRIYPRSNSGLTEDIVDSGGVVLSEFPPGTKPDYMNFPVRNRVVAGLSVGVLVIETGLTGGSMITARLALDQGREVFAIPHPLTSDKGGGGHRLIREGGAKLVETVSDVLDELPWLTGTVRVGPAPEPAWRSAELTPELRQICEVLDGAGRVSIEVLQERTGIPTSVLLNRLLLLEFEGCVRQYVGKTFEIA